MPRTALLAPAVCTLAAAATAASFVQVRPWTGAVRLLPAALTSHPALLPHHRARAGAGRHPSTAWASTARAAACAVHGTCGGCAHEVRP
ncbi:MULTISPECIES: hypothetical protein [Streptomyces]|uniref:Secreted protein n=1 Tax=Streptomyces fradiae ATCC 10745 = DSM 40063 TaxID=1319510 RepID=A0A1Y2NXU7_STRFR|nr:MULTISPECIES: hypothetical protein [Streptomyces]KAF0647511.1 hypothetical protein K701_23385 [Streptomyces fradiae ATCC 10745 = DSM 40063]KAF0647578.1 hypothetical protein K701_22675 [Streptomyces fradiae ATCC 10745 = DSM 40063]OSY51748.1 hypothetical protein BG846_02602 [Streptomyces fradiae ATCC 10745 = DSM 40063]QEV15335.1 hypothetical protein CP974_29085 [Streptomyces fradiae ATCC 10745 = DSM 40063]UQS30176.1 hypothetical protein J5J01_25695 [Streptomyces fradiae]